MAIISIRHRQTKKQRAASAAGKAGSAAWTFLKARVAWVAGKKVAKVAVPAAAVGTAAVVAKKRSGASHPEPAPSTSGVNAVPPTAAGVA
ncbi:MAG: hypothetical protein ABUM26_02925 [Solirubrobacterales bacterium]